MNKEIILDYATHTPENTNRNVLRGMLDSLIKESGGGGGGDGSDQNKYVKFFDYDGTLLHTYKVSDLITKNEMPENPTHEGLISRGWNYTFDEAIEQARDVGMCHVGQLYITDDGKTRLHIELGEENLSPYLGLGLNGSAIIDWGDGSEPDTITGTSLTTNKYTNHTFSSPGEYTITIEPLDGYICLPGKNISGDNWYSKLLCSDSNDTATYSEYIKCLKGVNFGNKLYLNSGSFSRAENLMFVTMTPDFLTYGSRYIFSSNRSLQFVVIPKGKFNEGIYTFNFCTSLEGASIPLGHRMGTQFFGYCESLREIVLPLRMDTNKVSLDKKFYGCKNLETAYISQDIDSSCFQNCEKLSNVIISNSVRAIETEAFNGCVSLENINIPRTIIYIGTKAFISSGITSFTHPGVRTSYGNYVLSYTSKLKGENVNIDGIGYIPYGFFQGSGIESFTIPNGVTNIPEYTFSECTKLKSITIPNGVTGVARAAFMNTTSLESIVFPESLVSMRGYEEFFGSALKEIHFLSKTPPKLTDSSLFSGVSNECVVYVPNESLDLYKTADKWSTYSNRIVGE